MSVLTDRLRDVLASGVGRTASSILPGASPAHDPASATSAAVGLGGEWCTSRSHPFLIVNRKYPGGHRHGRVAVLDALPPATGTWERLPLLAGSGPRLSSINIPPGRLVFLDLETTGLAGGAGTYAFLIGCAWFEGAAFHVRQFFLSSLAAERGILEALNELAASASALVTFNGKSFDIPLIDTRFALNRLPSPLGELPHIDMLHAARRFWRQPEDGPTGEFDDDRGRGCRLSDLEWTVCGHERDGDVPGFEIPARYFHYVRSGDTSGLNAVLEHNRLDLLSLAFLTARASQMLDEGPASARTAREALGIGMLYERAGRLPDARTAYAAAAGLGNRGDNGEKRDVLITDETTQAEALRAYALVARRERLFPEAARAWRYALEIKRCPPRIAREATEALAVHHEHRARDLRAARGFAMQSLQYRSTSSRTQAIQHRLARLDRKLARPGEDAGLF
jgi:uncharacterized protein YprB with RNaseH-like and TPR domain